MKAPLFSVSHTSFSFEGTGKHFTMADLLVILMVLNSVSTAPLKGEMFQ